MPESTTSYFRPAIDAMEGYVPGEQPKGQRIIKLNTNENPNPPSPKAIQALRDFESSRLCRYPDPVSFELRETIAAMFSVSADWVLTGNGSDDILTIVIRSFTGGPLKLAHMDPSYSLYPILADIQEAETKEIQLDDQFELPADLLEQVADCNLLILTRPNAPTGNAYPKGRVREIARQFDGIVLIDEAYADFAADHCADLVNEFDNVIICRTVSKSYALACVRLGYALAQPKLISGMMKVKDSYNVNGLTQAVATAAFRDQEYLKTTVAGICATRERVAAELGKLGFSNLESQTNFLFAKPPCSAAALFQALKENGVLVRYFSAERCKDYLRITIGTDEEMDEFLQTTSNILEDMTC